MLAMCLQAAFFTGSGEKSIGRPSSSVDAPLQRALAGGVHPSSRIKLQALDEKAHRFSCGMNRTS